MSVRGSWMMASAVWLAACGSMDPEREGDDSTSLPAETELNKQEEALHQTRASLGAWAAPGFCSDLKEVLGIADSSYGRVAVKGVISCFYGYGVDGVGLWGDVRTGYLGGVAQSPSAVINGQTVGVMDAVLVGAPAQQLFNAMSRTWSVYLPDDHRVSGGQRIYCTKPAQGQATCQLRDFVGFETRSVHF